MFAQRSLLLAAASAFTVSTVFAHPHGPHHIHQHAKRQENLQLSYVTFYQTQPHGPDGTVDIVYTMTSPVWIPAGAVATGTGIYNPVITPSDDPVPVATLEAPSVLAVAETPSALAVPETPSAPAVVVEEPRPTFLTEASSTIVVAEPVVTPQPLPSIPTTAEPSVSSKAPGEHKTYSGKLEDYPAESKWLSFDALRQSQKGTFDSRGMWSNNVTDAQIELIVQKVKLVSESNGIDARVLFAMVNQESNGVATVLNGGIMQATPKTIDAQGVEHLGEPCNGSWDDVEKQIRCAVDGNLIHCVKKYPQGAPWIYLHCYNSGINAYTEGQDLHVAENPDYLDDIASRLVNGWTN
ncbi:hypothetical protein BDV95DRAFT_608580 [Massariosphaeria phaeospora]|uniref:Transglycosylase SLT domain-containing protein n=1 Tax=Massariosphaeria phaeospora TaxID=100035 RepID=A0A7C8MHQ2_9PLEO|nr:hypothetical protein BDV95DRAFT_608580 [Massariosphaeria phaeospora]